ncbi:UNVERIFIED_CONTAM: hypothetical protein FKN15_031825 [Acipenser sinensis]
MKVRTALKGDFSWINNKNTDEEDEEEEELARAPHSVRSKAVSPAPEEPPSSTEERTKRTEAASSVIKSSASKERSYVLSAVNKYGVEINDEEPEEDSDTSPRIAPKSSLNPALKQKPTAAPRKLSPSTETKTQTTVTKETVFDIPKNPISTESKTKSSSPETKNQTTMTKKETVSETPKPLTEPETKSSQDTKSLWDKWDLSAPTETTTTTVTEKSSQDTKSPWDKWDKPAATETAITTVTEKSSQGTKSAWDKWDVPAATEITTTTITEKSPSTEIQTQTTVTKKETVFETEPVTESPSTEIQTQTTVTKKETVFETEPVTERLVMVKEYVNSTGFNPSEYTSINNYDDITYSRSNYSYSSPSAMYRSPGTSCTYCGEMVGDDARITIEHLNIYSHPSCFKCGVCSKPMGELLESMYIHSGQVHCDSCYDKVF